MPDEWGEVLFEAKYGDILIDIVTTDDDLSRTLVRHEFPFRDGAVLRDTGAVPRSTTGQVIFVPTTDQTANHRDRAIEFLNFLSVAYLQSPTPQFTHPLFGMYPALPENISVSAAANDRDFIGINVTFVEAGLDPAAFETLGDESVEVGVAAVEDAGEVLTEQLAILLPDLDPPVTVQDDALVIAQGWADISASDVALSPRQVNLELNQITDEISDETERLGVADDANLYPVYAAMIQLHATMRRAADLAIATGPVLTEITVPRTEPLLALMTEIFGGATAVDQYNRTLELNDIDNPACVEAGTRIVIEQP